MSSRGHLDPSRLHDASVSSDLFPGDGDCPPVRGGEESLGLAVDRCARPGVIDELRPERRDGSPGWVEEDRLDARIWRITRDYGEQVSVGARGRETQVAARARDRVSRPPSHEPGLARAHCRVERDHPVGAFEPQDRYPRIAVRLDRHLQPSAFDVAAARGERLWGTPIGELHDAHGGEA